MATLTNLRHAMLKIALEEHFDAPGMVAAGYDAADVARFPREARTRIRSLLEDLDDTRIATMDTCGIHVMVLSQTAPGVQAEKDAAKAARLAREANDYLAQRIARHPTRYIGFAHLALQDPRGAADELERCVRQLRFVGALINHHTNGEYLDDDRFAPFWERVVALDVPVYLHPADPYDLPHVYRGCPGLSGPVWTWNCETSAHALRLVFAGTFDRFPGAKLILGHMGETIPFYLWRLDSRFALMNPSAERKPSEIIRQHLYVTTSGVCSNAALRCSIDELGSDHVLFSTDYPYEDAQLAARWIEAAPLTDDERKNVCYENAQRILKTTDRSIAFPPRRAEGYED
jgi:2,3-dihydroxybenzoate decarboxylase